MGITDGLESGAVGPAPEAELRSEPVPEMRVLAEIPAVPVFKM